jgi:hypothetical protein
MRAARRKFNADRRRRRRVLYQHRTNKSYGVSPLNGFARARATGGGQRGLARRNRNYLYSLSLNRAKESKAGGVPDWHRVCSYLMTNEKQNEQGD